MIRKLALGAAAMQAASTVYAVVRMFRVMSAWRPAPPSVERRDETLPLLPADRWSAWERFSYYADSEYMRERFGGRALAAVPA